MAKSTKKNALFDQVKNVENELNNSNTIIEEKHNTSLNTESAIENLPAFKNDIDLKIKIEQYDNLESENKALIKEKEELLEKMNEYLVELDTLRSNNEEYSNLYNMYTKLSNEIESLQSEREEFMLKISELTFENAKLLSEINEYKTQLSKNINVQTKQNTITRQQPTQTRYIPQQPTKNTLNGYDSWN